MNEKEINRVFNCDILNPSRKRENVEGRIAYSKIMRGRFKMTLEKIGIFFNKDHSTITHYLKKHDDFMKYDSIYRDKFNSISKPIISSRWLCVECDYFKN